MAGSSASLSSNMGVILIEHLTPVLSGSKIRARVTCKTKKPYDNKKGQGIIFSMDLHDESGEIRAVAFNDDCEKFYDIVEEHKVYYISSIKVQDIPPEYRESSLLRKDFEILLTQDSSITPCNDVTIKIPALLFDFVPISDLQNKIGDKTAVIGICKEVHSVKEVNGKDNKKLKKRDVKLLDDSGTEASLTLWNKEAEDFDGRPEDVVAVRGARVSEYNGNVFLSPIKGGWVRVNPKIPKSRALRDWYKKEEGQVQTPSLSSSRRNLMEALSQQESSSSKGFSLSYSGTPDDEGDIGCTPSQEGTGVAVLPTASSQGPTAQDDLRIQFMKQEHELRMKLLQEDHDTTLELKRKKSSLEIKLLEQQQKHEAEIFKIKKAKLQEAEQSIQ